MKKHLFIIFLFAGIFTSTGQDLNSYRYVLVPEKFDFQKEPNQYQLNALAKFLFEKYGFEAFLEGEEIPAELSQNRCDGLYANVTNDSGLFRTRLLLTLKDCNNKVVYTSPEGVSAEKDFQTAFHEALRNAFENLETLNYDYRETIVSGRPVIEKPVVDNKVQKEVPAEIVEKPEAPLQIELRMEPKVEKEMLEEKAEATTLNFSKEDAFFYLEKSQNGYSFFQKGMAEPFAALIKSSAGNNFIYSSITSKGMAYFDENGNLVVEVLNPQTNSLETVVYKVQP